MIRKTAQYAAAFCAALLCLCGADRIAGGSSQQGNGVVVCRAQTQRGTPVANAVVRLRPADYLSRAYLTKSRVASSRIVNARTDDSGRVYIERIDTGSYFLEITDEESTAVGIPFTVTPSTDTVDLRIRKMQPFAAVAGVIASLHRIGSAMVGVYGLERSFVADSSGQAFAFRDIPAGSFIVRVEPVKSDYRPAEKIVDSVSAGDSANTGTAVIKRADADSFSLRIAGEELIFAADQSHNYHSPTIVEIPGGVVAAWRRADSATFDKSNDIWMSYTENGAWATPYKVADEPDMACYDPVLFVPAGGPMMLFYKAGPDNASWWGVVKTSADTGKTWSAGRKLGTDPAVGNLIGPSKGTPIQFTDGTILAGANQPYALHFEISRDTGATWEVVGPVADPLGLKPIQPAFLRHADGRLQVLCRNEGAGDAVPQSWSSDSGKTWSDVSALDIGMTKSRLDALTLDNGMHLLAYNPPHNWRRTLWIAHSSNGIDWEHTLTLEDGKGGQKSYPAMAQTADRRIHVVYTYNGQSIKHVVLE